MAEKGKIDNSAGQVPAPKVPYNPPSPPRIGPGSGGGRVPVDRPNPPRTPIQGAGGDGTGVKRGMFGSAKVPAYKKGGRVKKTGVALLHKGEEVVTKGHGKASGKAHGKRKATKR